METGRFLRIRTESRCLPASERQGTGRDGLRVPSRGAVERTDRQVLVQRRKEHPGRPAGHGQTRLAPLLLPVHWEASRGLGRHENGLLDIEAAARGEPVKLRQHTPDFFSTFARPFDWDPEAACPMWDKFLAEVAPNPENQGMLQKLAGLLLVEDVTFQVFFDLYGSGQNGKGVFKAVLQALIGLENICRVPLSDFAEKFTVSELTQKRVNLVGDAETADAGARFRPMGALEGLLKEVTGGPDATMKLEPKGVQGETARPVKARCVFLTNSLTPWVDRTKAIWRRWRLIPFTETISDDKVDGNLVKKIHYHPIGRGLAPGMCK